MFHFVEKITTLRYELWDVYKRQDNTLHNLFAKVSAAEALAGSTKYRGIYIKNENGHTLTLQDAKMCIRDRYLSESKRR